MEASLFHFVLHWLLALIRAGAWLWSLSLLLALCGWVVWSLHRLPALARRALGPPGRRHVARRSAPEPRDPALPMGIRR